MAEADASVESNNISIIQALEGLDIQPQPAPRLSFLGLPAELRLRVYDFLPMPQVPPIPDVSPSESQSRNDGRTAFAILHTSRQTHTEAKPVLYANIEVRTSHLKYMPPHAKQYIRSAIISARYDTTGVRLARSTSKKLWCCEPALTQFNLTNRWPLENMFRYLARAWPGIQHVRIKVEGHCLDPDVEFEGELPESAVKEARSKALLQNLRCVVIQHYVAEDELESMRDFRPLAESLAMLFVLREDVNRLSPGAVVVWEQEEDNDLGFPSEF